MLKHNGHPPAITAAAIDPSPADQKGGREALAHAQIGFDPFHVPARVSPALEAVRWRETASAPETKALLKQTPPAFRKNPENLTEKEAGRLEDPALKHPASGPAYLIRLERRAIDQRTVKPERARCRLESWINRVRGQCERLGACLAPMAKGADTSGKQLEGILAHWTAGGGLATGFLEALNRGSSAVKRKARGYRSSE